MRKKIFVALIFSVLTLTLVGCAKKPNAPSPCWTYLEEYTYEVKYVPEGTDLSVVGEMKYKIELINNVDISCGDYSIAAFFGTKITTSQTYVVEGVTNTIETVSFINNKQSSYLSSQTYNLTANNTYKIVENKRSITAKYDEKTYTYKENDEEKTMKIKGKVIVDTNSLYVVLRAYDVLHTGFSSSYDVPNPLKDTMVKLMLSTSGTSDVTALGDKIIKSACINIRLDDKYSGTPIVAYYAIENLTFDVSADKKIELKKVPVKIVEGNTTYVLKSIDNARDTRD